MKLVIHIPLLAFAALAAPTFGQDCTAETDIQSFDLRTQVADLSDDGRVLVGHYEFPSVSVLGAVRWDPIEGLQRPLGLFLYSHQATAVSADGNTFVATMDDVLGVDEAVRVSTSSGVSFLPRASVDVIRQQPVAVSDQGTFIAGNAVRANATENSAFLWSPASGTRDLGTLPGGDASSASDLSGDGSTVVGEVSFPGGVTRGFRWTNAGGMRDLGTLGGPSTRPLAVSQDGSVVVGVATDSAGRSRAFRWTLATGIQDIAPAMTLSMTVVGVSSDGNVVAGDIVRGSSTTAYRWTLGSGVQDLGTMTGTETFAIALSKDGSTVVGDIVDGSDRRPFRWNESGGAFDLGPFGSTVTRAVAVSADGSVVVGQLGVTERIFRAEFGSLGLPACRPWTPNSTGCGGFLRVTGSAEVAANAMSLEASFLPQNTAGFFLVAPALAPPVIPPSSQGSLCLAQPIGRYVGPGQILNSGPDGSFSLAVDLTAIPTPTGFVSAAPGETWCFQAWHRDANPTSTSNFTDAVSVTLR